jgi:hypothetical protein
MLGLLPSCLTLRHETFESFEPPRAGVLASLESDSVTTLDDCVSALGAPLLVLEDGDRTAMAWGWQRQKNWFVTLSVPLLKGLNTSVSYNSFVLRLNGVMGFFDADNRLVELRRGYLNDLVDGRQVRPQVIEARPAGGHE